MRRGISLLEVLVAIFITAVGLLAVAALIPVGTFYVGEANKNVRGWDMAQVAYHQMQVQDMMEPAHWTDAFGARPSWDSAFVIDPYFLARNGGIYAATQADARTDRRYWFPFRSNDDAGTAAAYQVARLSVRSWGHRAAPAMFSDPFDDQDGNRVRNGGEQFNDLDGNGRWDDRSFLADRIFTGHDDLALVIPDDKDGRPMPMNPVEPFTDTNSNGRYDLGEPFNDLDGDSLYQVPRPGSVGDFSWLITASPAHYPVNTGLYNVSVVVLHKRTAFVDPAAEQPSERTVFADIEGNGAAILHYTSAGTEYLDIKAGSWLLLTGTIPGPPPVKLMRWYRVVHIGEQEPDANAPNLRRRRVTLQGPDMNQSLFRDESNATVDSLRPNTNWPTIHATIVTGVVNVFERTMRVDAP